MYLLTVISLAHRFKHCFEKTDILGTYPRYNVRKIFWVGGMLPDPPSISMQSKLVVLQTSNVIN